jgi:hypothetical protein
MSTPVERKLVDGKRCQQSPAVRLSAVADSAAEKANRAGRGECRTVDRLGCLSRRCCRRQRPRNHGGNPDGFAIASQHATAAGVARRTSAASRKAKRTNASRLPIQPR